jgi:Flp pilus assembly protein TadG
MTLKSERGAMVIMVAIALLGLTIFSAIVLDYGVLWSARAQAQNAADAGALAAADYSITNAGDVPGAREAARRFAHANAIWGEAPLTANIDVTMPVTCPAGTGGGLSCVKVDVHRGDGSHTNTLPTMFAQLAGITSQSISATATAQLAGANHADCLRPWFVLDRAGVGYTTADIGTDIVLDSRVVNSGFGKIDVGNGETGVKDSVYQCAPGGGMTIGDTVPTQTGSAGNPTARAVNDVIDWDYNAHYDPITKTIQGSCTPNCTCLPYASCPNGNRMSPRIFVAPMCSPVGDAGCVSGGNGSTHEVTITKFLSFFVTSATAHGGDIEIHATLIAGAGDLDEGPADPGGFLQVVRLVR